MYRGLGKVLTVLGLAVVVAGCATTGGSQFQNTVYDTHRRVVKLEQDLGGSVTKLNETAAELTARVDQSDQATRRLQTLIEENQAQLQTIQRQLSDLMNKLYRQGGYTGTTPSPSAAPAAGGVVIEAPGPSGSAQTVESPVERVELEVAEAPAGESVAINVSPTPAEATPAPPAPGASAPEGGTGGSGGDADESYRRAQRTYANEDYAAARGQFQEFLQQHPGSELGANAQFWLGKCYLNLDQYNEAIGEFEKVRTSFPSDSKVPFAMHNEAVAYSRLGQTDRAKELLQEVVEKYPRNPAADQAQTDLKKLQGN
jgi:tol-pal system protein YbgF